MQPAKDFVVRIGCSTIFGISRVSAHVLSLAADQKPGEGSESPVVRRRLVDFSLFKVEVDDVFSEEVEYSAVAGPTEAVVARKAGHDRNPIFSKGDTVRSSTWCHSRKCEEVESRLGAPGNSRQFHLDALKRETVFKKEARGGIQYLAHCVQRQPIRYLIRQMFVTVVLFKHDPGNSNFQ